MTPEAQIHSLKQAIEAQRKYIDELEAEASKQQAKAYWELELLKRQISRLSRPWWIRVLRSITGVRP